MRIFKYLKKYWLLAILAPIAMIFEVAMDLVQPKLMAVIVDYGINYSVNKEVLEASYSTFFVNYFNNRVIWGASMDPQLVIILNCGLLMILSVLFGGTCGVLSGVFTNHAAYRYGNDLRIDVFKHTMNLSFEQTDKFTTGSLVTRMTNDITQVQNMAAMSMRTLVRSLMQFVFGTVMLLSIKSEFGIILLIALPIQIVLVFVFIKLTAPHFTEIQECVDDVNAVVQENVTGARVVKAYVKEEHETKRFAKANQNLYDSNWKVFKIMAFMSPVMTIVLSTAMVAIIYFGGVTIKSNFDSGILDGLRVGEVMSAITYVTTILMGFLMLAIMFQVIIRGIASVKRLNAVLDSEPSVKNGDFSGETEETGTIEFKNVSFKYDDIVSSEIMVSDTGEEIENGNVLNDISFKVQKGERIGILGSTGCGKTSLVNLITRFYDCTSGEVFVDGKNVKEYDLISLRDKVSIALQKSELYSYTIEENIKWGKKDATHEEVLWASRVAQADSFITSFDEGYNTVVAEKGASLSGGQKQRISIARTLIGKPEIVIFDDATSALDLATEAELYKELDKEMSDTTLIIIAQRIASVKNADKILVLNEGNVVAFDNHENLMKNCPIYIDIYNSQLKKEA